MSRVGCGDFFTVLRSSAEKKYYSDLDALRSFLLKFADEERKKHIASRAKMHTVPIPVGACSLCDFRFLLGRIPKTPFA